LLSAQAVEDSDMGCSSKVVGNVQADKYCCEMRRGKRSPSNGFLKKEAPPRKLLHCTLSFSLSELVSAAVHLPYDICFMFI